MNEDTGMPSQVEVRSLLADGSTLRITATRRPRAGRAELKCEAPWAPLAARMRQVALLARHTEARYDSRDQVVLGMDRTPGVEERDWELALVLADRGVRGLLRLAPGLLANGWSDSWQLGRIDGHDVRGASAGAAAAALLGGPGHLAYLGALCGQPDAAAAVSSARAWFPLHSGGVHDRLCWVEVSVHPLDAAEGTEVGADEEAQAIAAPGLEGARLAALRRVLAGARHFDGDLRGRWRTAVRFEEPGFEGDSYELALVMADRLARGRDFVPRGRILASGRSGSWHAGTVDTVEGLLPKCALIEREAGPGDRVLLPRAWEAQLPPSLRPALRARGASLACVERIGII